MKSGAQLLMALRAVAITNILDIGLHIPKNRRIRKPRIATCRFRLRRGFGYWIGWILVRLGNELIEILGSRLTGSLGEPPSTDPEDCQGQQTQEQGLVHSGLGSLLGILQGFGRLGVLL